MTIEAKLKLSDEEISNISGVMELLREMSLLCYEEYGTELISLCEDSRIALRDLFEVASYFPELENICNNSNYSTTRATVEHKTKTMNPCDDCDRIDADGSASCYGCKYKYTRGNDNR